MALGHATVLEIDFSSGNSNVLLVYFMIIHENVYLLEEKRSKRIKSMAGLTSQEFYYR